MANRNREIGDTERQTPERPKDAPWRPPQDIGGPTWLGGSVAVGRLQWSATGPLGRSNQPSQPPWLGWPPWLGCAGAVIFGGESLPLRPVPFNAAPRSAPRAVFGSRSPSPERTL